MSAMLWSVCDTFRTRRGTQRQLGFVAITFLVILTLYYFSLPAPVHVTHWGEHEGVQSNTTPEEWKARVEQVKQAFRHAYGGYERYAMPHDELLPVSNKSIDNFNGWGVTLFDSLDTMILMELNDELSRAIPVVAAADFVPSPNATSEHVGYAPFFETVIRYLGGLLSAYALSRERVFLQKADELGRLLSPAFDTPTGFPTFGVNTVNGNTIGLVEGVLAEIASCQLEYMYLAMATGDRFYYDKVDSLLKSLYNAPLLGMFPSGWNIQTGQPTDDIYSVGAAADSAHEYLLKLFLLTAKTDKDSYQMYLRTTNHVLTHMLFVSEQRELLYVTDTKRKEFLPTHKFEHLSCFLPGLLALGADQLDLSLDDMDPHMLIGEARRSYEMLKPYNLRDVHKWAAEGLATSCYLMYADQPTGLGPDEVLMRTKSAGEQTVDGIRMSRKTPGGRPWILELEKWHRGGRKGPAPGLGEKLPVRFTDEELANVRLKAAKAAQRDYDVKKADYGLRPETLESIYLLWRTTGNHMWRERGWEIFQAIERHTKTSSGYASVKHVLHVPAHLLDDMPSFFLAETLKYLYLLFLDRDALPLNRWVFNTEAHPLPVFEWSAWERAKFGIPEPSS